MTEPTPVPEDAGGGFRTATAPPGVPSAREGDVSHPGVAAHGYIAAPEGEFADASRVIDRRAAAGLGHTERLGFDSGSTPTPPSSAPHAANADSSAGTDHRTAEEVEAGIVALWRSYGQSREQVQRDRLVLHYAPLVKYVAGRVGTGLPSHVDVADLVQSGIFGLVDAIEKFEPERGLKFETYAMQRIRGAILDDLRAQDWVPRSVRSRAKDLERALERLEARLQRSATDPELAAELSISVAELRELWSQLRMTSVAALDELITAGQGTSSFAETLPDDRAEDPVATLVDRDSRRQLADAIAQLSERDRIVVTLYYFENLTLAEIGKVLGVTESRVCQLHTRAVLRLRTKLAEQAEG
jgi:RNA polymerase sigma factor FliA